MRRSPVRRAAAALGAMTLVFSLGVTGAVLVARPAAASSPPKQTTTKKTTTKPTKKTKPTKSPSTPTPTTTPDSPAAHFFVINGTVNAASDHVIVGSSAFPNFTTGAVDNYYSMAHSHVDNSPFAQGTASPADTGPIGQTAAAGNTQQPQYADARWPGNSGKASYGNQGGPYAVAEADEYRATAEASEAKNGLSAPGPTGASSLAVPKGFDGRLRGALAEWKGTWQGRLAPKRPKPAVTTPVATVTVPNAKVKPPTATVTTPVATVTTPHAPVAGLNSTPPPAPVPVPAPAVPSIGAAAGTRSLASATTPADGESLLASSSLATLDSKTNTLVTSGESSLGRVSIGGGQIVIEGIHVTASITNDGTPTHKAAVSVASATIGGVPVTIDQDGVHLAGQGAGLPFQQASDALNGALKQAGIQLFLVGPEVTKPCGQTGTGTGGGTTTTSTTTTTSSTTTTSDQSGTTGGSCDQTGSTSCNSSGGGGGGGGPSLPSMGSSTTTTSSNDQTGTTTTSSCGQTGSTSCDQTGTTTNGTTTTTGGVTGIGPGTTTSKTTTTTRSTTTTKTTTDQTNTTATPSGCGQSGTLPSTTSCGKAGTTTGTTSTSTGPTDTTAPPSPFDPLGGAGSAASEETVRATGVHLVFTQPVNQAGVPAQFVEHILGEVFVNSLAVPAGKPPDLGLSASSSSSSSSSSSLSSCGGGHSSKTTAGGAATAGGSSSAGGSTSSAGGSAASGSLSPSAATAGSASQTGSGSSGNSLPAAFAAALRKPLWLLLAYVLWQALVIGTGASLWNWRRGDAS